MSASYATISAEFAERAKAGLLNGKAKARAPRLFIEGATIYSYGRHFPIARIVSPNEVRFTTARYSSSTSRQTNEVRGALNSAGVQLRLVSDVMADV